ncbi:MAG: JAB domain-containing protein [Xanthomonadales bacterium]|nr:JAB domain-containing protein [Xanthomonadales bacterium]
MSNNRRPRVQQIRCWACHERPSQIRRPEDLLPLLWPEFTGANLDSREKFGVVILDARHAPMAPPQTVSIGSLNASLVHPREVFAPAIVARAAAVIVYHNHPSGDPRPSADDLELTGRLDRAGELLGLALLDHFILCPGDLHGESAKRAYTSIREYGWPAPPSNY